jgi:hypothetical protein
MSDQSWAIIVGAAVVIALRILDFFFPKGRWYTWGGRTSKVDDDGDNTESKSD